MNLQHLPPEILAQILGRVFPRDWYRSPERHECMKLRLVSRLFDNVVSGILFRTSNGFTRLERSRPWNDDKAIWVLSTKIKLDSVRCDELSTYIYRWASFMANRDCWPLENVGDLYQWIEVACRAVVHQLGADWVRKWLPWLNEGVAEMSLDLSLPEKLSIASTSTSDDESLKLESESAQGSIQLACCGGDVERVKFLLSRGADATLSHSHFGSPLPNAVRNGHSELVQCLLDVGPAIRPPDGFGNLLKLAVEHGRPDAFQCLLRNTPTEDSHILCTCLTLACRKGYADIVRGLLQWGDIEAKRIRKTQGWAKSVARSSRARIFNVRLSGKPIYNCVHFVEDPNWFIYQAASHGHAEIVRILITRPAYRPCDPAREDCPLRVTRDPSIASLLLNTYRPKAKGFRGRVGIPFVAACRAGNLPLVKAFLAWPYLNPNANGPKGHSTALNEAITASWTYLPTTNVEMVQAILEHPKINPNLLAAEEMSRPLGTAIQHDDKAILEVLLSRPDVNPNLSHGECSTFLTFAIETGNLEIVRRLLQRPDIDPNMRDKGLNHNTPLLAAVYSKRYDIIEELLKHTGLDPNGQSLEPSLGTALFYTAGKGREPVVKLLLTRPDIDVNLGNSNATPLANAILGDHIGTVELLLAHDKIDPNYAPKFPKTYTRLHSRPGQDKTFELKTSYTKKNKRYVRMIPLCLAAEGGHLQSSMMLLDHPTIDINVTDGTGRTALWWAVFRGLPDLVRLLLDRGAGAVINLKDVQGWTPLHVATNYSYPLPVDYLLEHPDVDPNAINQDGDAPLHLSIYSNDIDTVAKLLKHPKINKRLPMKGGVTPFQLAKKLGHQRMLHELRPDTL
ncbi:unnamed protein product [Clonostachys rosea f. rosea IK726]|uniref:F-box domain-containing protein n=2 Tax=Bionectria ochroleuca TaxID=29856 RepID=A0A0B7JSG6_BIOOC|nr:unnamed protein product [Clonostachys rosea f. rosea IK726]